MNQEININKVEKMRIERSDGSVVTFIRNKTEASIKATIVLEIELIE